MTQPPHLELIVAPERTEPDQRHDDLAAIIDRPYEPGALQAWARRHGAEADDAG